MSTTQMVYVGTFALILFGGGALLAYFIKQMTSVPGTATAGATTTTSTPPPAPSPAPNTTQTPVKPSWLTRSNVFVAVGGLAVASILLYIFGDKIPQGSGGALSAVVMFLLGALLFTKGGTLGKWIGGFLMILALLFGPRAYEALRTGQDKASGIVLDDKPIFKPQPAAPPKPESTAPTVIERPVLGQTYAITVNDREWSKAIRVSEDWCIRWWDDNPDSDTVTVSVRGVNDVTWYEWGEFRRLKALGKIPYQNAGWIRFMAKSGDAKLYYAFGRQGTCT